MFDVLGEPIDDLEKPKTEFMDSIHRDAPDFKDLTTSAEVFET
jgi:F-type H+-transporting ATPase subunit beta